MLRVETFNEMKNLEIILYSFISKANKCCPKNFMIPTSFGVLFGHIMLRVETLNKMKNVEIISYSFISKAKECCPKKFMETMLEMNFSMIKNRPGLNLNTYDLIDPILL